MIMNTIKADSMMIATHMRELAENIEHESERMADNPAMGFGDIHRAQAYRDSLSLWREAVPECRVITEKD